MPTSQTLYRFWNRDELLYVGISINAYTRAKEHERHSAWWNDATHVTFEKFPDRASVEQAELKAIRTERPKHNVIGAKRVQYRVPGAPSPYLTPDETVRLRKISEFLATWEEPDSQYAPASLIDQTREFIQLAVSTKKRTYTSYLRLLSEGEEIVAEWHAWEREDKLEAWWNENGI